MNYQNDNNLIYFDIDILGMLICEEIFMYYDEPILFTTNNKNKEKYLFLTIARYPDTSEWIVTKISKQYYEKLITNKVSVRYVYEFAEEGYVYYIKDSNIVDKIYICQQIQCNEIPKDDLPDDDLYINDEDELDDVEINEIEKNNQDFEPNDNMQFKFNSDIIIDNKMPIKYFNKIADGINHMFSSVIKQQNTDTEIIVNGKKRKEKTNERFTLIIWDKYKSWEYGF